MNADTAHRSVAPTVFALIELELGPAVHLIRHEFHAAGFDDGPDPYSRNSSVRQEIESAGADKPYACGRCIASRRDKAFICASMGT